MSKISIDPKLEKNLITKAQKNKREFSPLYKHYHRHILRYFITRVGSHEDAEDLTSVVFKKALEGLDSFRWQGVSFSAWLYRIARNTLIDYYRKQNKTKNSVDLEHVELSSLEKSPEEQAISSSFEQEMNKTLKELPEKEREIIYMKFFEGYTNKTIAKLTGLSESNVGTILHRTIRKLRDSSSKIG